MTHGWVTHESPNHIQETQFVYFQGKLYFRNCAISTVLPASEHLSSETRSLPEENARSAETLEALTVKYRNSECPGRG